MFVPGLWPGGQKWGAHCYDGGSQEEVHGPHTAAGAESAPQSLPAGQSVQAGSPAGQAGQWLHPHVRPHLRLPPLPPLLLLLLSPDGPLDLLHQLDQASPGQEGLRQLRPQQLHPGHLHRAGAPPGGPRTPRLHGRPEPQCQGELGRHQQGRQWHRVRLGRRDWRSGLQWTQWEIKQELFQ